MARPGPLHGCISATLLVAAAAAGLALCLSPGAKPSASGGAEARCEGGIKPSQRYRIEDITFLKNLPSRVGKGLLFVKSHGPAGFDYSKNIPNSHASKLCQDFLERFYGSLKEKHSDFSMASIEEELIKTCMNAKGKEHRLCYYLGATEDAATKILTEVSRPMSGHVPTTKICEKLKKVDLQICELKHEEQLDLASVDLPRMRVAELKKILDSWGEVCRACAEKTDFVNLIKELAPQHAAAPPPARADL